MKKSPKKQDFQSIWPLIMRLWRGYVIRYAWLLVIAVFLMFIEGSTLGLLSYLVKPMIDDVFIAGNYQQMTNVAIVFVVIFLARAVSTFGQRTLTVYVGLRVVATLQYQLVNHLLTLDSSFFRRHSPGTLIERVRGDTGSLQNIAANSIINLGRDGFSLISLISVTLYIDWVWTVLAFVGTPLIVLPVAALQRRIRGSTRRARAESAKLTSHLDEIFHGHKAIKSNLMEGYESERVQSGLRSVVKQQLRAEQGKAALPSMVDLIAGLGFVGVMIYGGMEIIEGEKTLGDFMSFFAAMAMVFDPVRRLTGLGGVLNAAAANLERLYELLDTKAKILDGEKAKKLRKPKGDIEFKNVTFNYGRKKVIDDLSIVIPAGKLTALVGESGAGKTTMFNLMCRFEDIQQGEITIGEQSIHDIPITELRRHIALVTQETALFDQSIRDNIAYGRWDAIEKDIEKAARSAMVHKFIDTMEDGMQSEAGPRGSNLSGGQRQRVVIARAILRNVPVLLLDEATSALDSQTEFQVQQALEHASEGRTTVVIAHRLSTIEQADRIYVIDNGRVVESGNHKSLLAKKGQYAKFHKKLGKQKSS